MTIQSQLISLCEAGSWDAARLWCLSHPQEAAPSKKYASTALSVAVRNGAPVSLIVLLVTTNASQLEIVDKDRGTVLHEVLSLEQYHKSSAATAKYLIDYAMRHGTTCQRHSGGRRSLLLAEVNKQMQTPLLAFMYQAVGQKTNKLPIQYILEITKMLVQAYPSAIQTPDIIGISPVKVIVGTERSKSMDMEYELMIFDLLRIMLAEDPRASLGYNYNKTTDDKFGSNWEGYLLLTIYNWLKRKVSPSPCKLELTVLSMLDSSCIHDAISNRRSEAIVDLLLETSHSCLKESEISPCAVALKTEATQKGGGFHLLDWCILTGASTLVMKLVLDRNPSSAALEQKTTDSVPSNSSTPVSLLWLTYFLKGMGDTAGYGGTGRTTMASVASLHQPTGDEIRQSASNADRRLANLWRRIKARQSLRTYTTPQLDHLWGQAKLLLPAAAATVQRRLAAAATRAGKDDNMDQHLVGEWPALHAACFLYDYCPVGYPIQILLLTLCYCFEQLQWVDSRGNLPAHYIAASVRHPPMAIGVCPPISTVLEAYPAAASIPNAKGQLPLHIITQNFHANHTSYDALEFRETIPLVRTTMGCYPEALEIRNPITRLYPFMDAAATHITYEGDARDIVDTVYRLLRENPTMIQAL
eukprot:scaffold19579_cov52-Attheya_sp.AAC.3